MSWPTVRRYPRTLADAFPDVRAACLECPERHRVTLRPLADVALAVAIGVALALAIVYGWEV